MLFNSFLFIFIFLPLVLLGWYGLNRFGRYELAKVFLVCMSLWFYGYFNYYYLAIILVSIAVNYLFSYLCTKIHTKTLNRTCLTAGILFNLGLLFYFKYYDFFVENINAAFHTGFTLKHILLPLGISFFTFQQLSFIIDRFLGKAEHYPLISYMTFVTFFPQLIAGPIVLYKEVLPQFDDLHNRRFQPDQFAQGIQLFVIGLAKKVLLADVLALAVNYGYAQTFSLDTPSTIFVMLAYTFELYFDFSGYSDMAMGLARFFNVTLPVNFNSPYLACSTKEFWQRWHITLSRFFITYVYIPLGGSRKGKARMLLNILIVFLLSGLWHGAAWTYVAWGVLEGLLVIWGNLNIVGIRGREEKYPARFHIPAWLGWLCTFTVFNLSLFLFRSSSILAAVQMFRNLFSFSNTGKLFQVAATLDVSEFYVFKRALEIILPSVANYAYILIFILYLALSFFLIFRKNALSIATDGKLTSGRCLLLSVLFVWSIVSLSQVSTFLYFNF